MASWKGALTMPEDMHARAVRRAKEAGFGSFSDYTRFLIQEDLSGPGLEHVEDAVVTSISKLSGKLTAIHTAQQKLYSLAWEIADMLVRVEKDERGPESEQALIHLRTMLAREFTPKENV